MNKQEASVLTQPQKDYLTGFFLRDAFYSTLERSIIEARSKRTNLSVILFDLDQFKKYNDKFGHLFGDNILKHVAGILRLFFPENLCFRFGGDEFIVILPDKDIRQVFYLLLEFKKYIYHAPFLSEGKSYKPVKISFSCGISRFPSDGEHIEELIKRADEAMYLSKHYGHNLFTLAERVKYIKFRNMFIFIVGVSLIIAALTILYQSTLKKSIHDIIRYIRDVKIVTESDLDIVMLKNGGVLEGKILEETAKKVVINVYLEKGKVSLVLEKSEIANIRYSPKEQIR